MSVSIRGNQCTLFMRLDEEAYAEQSGQAYEVAEAAAAETDTYPVVYPEPYNSMGCGYGRLMGFVKEQCSALAHSMNLDIETCEQSDFIVTLYCGSRAQYEVFIEQLGDRLQPVVGWVLNTSELFKNPTKGTSLRM